jgi:hypothetical protein
MLYDQGFRWGKPDSLHPCDCPWISGYHVQNSLQNNIICIQRNHSTIQNIYIRDNSVYEFWYKPLGLSEKWKSCVAVARASSLRLQSSPQASLSEATQPFLHGFLELGLSLQVRSCTLTKLSPRNGIGSRHRLYVALSGLTLKGKKSVKVKAQVSYAAAAKHKQKTSRYKSQTIPSSQLGNTWYPGAPSPHPISI